MTAPSPAPPVSDARVTEPGRAAVEAGRVTDAELKLASDAVLAEWKVMQTHLRTYIPWPVSPTNWRILRAGWDAIAKARAAAAAEGLGTVVTRADVERRFNVDAAVKKLRHIGEHHHWWPVLTQTQIEADPIGASEFGGVIVDVLLAAASSQSPEPSPATSTERAGSDVVAVWKERALRAAGEREIARDKERIARQAARNAEAEAIEFGSALEVAEARVAALEVERDAAWIAGRDAASIVAADDEGRLTVWGEDRNTRVAQQTGLDIAAHIRALQPPTATAGDKTDAG